MQCRTNGWLVALSAMLVLCTARQVYADGACCFAGGGCAELSVTDCNNFGGLFQGDGTFCDSSCVGACCLSDGSCTATTALNCETALGGLYQGLFTDCASVVCPGACCLASGNCATLTVDDCNASGGYFVAFGVDCSDIPSCLGACCFDCDPCVEVTGAECVTLGGNFQGVDTDCATANCPALTHERYYMFPLSPGGLVFDVPQFDEMGGKRQLTKVTLSIESQIGADIIVTNISPDVIADVFTLNLQGSLTKFFGGLSVILNYIETRQAFNIGPGETFDFGRVSASAGGSDVIDDPLGLIFYVGNGTIPANIAASGNFTFNAPTEFQLTVSNFTASGLCRVIYEYVYLAGACCDPCDSTCIDDLTSAECAASGGIWKGTCTRCENLICAAIGACCDPCTQVCTDGLTESQCDGQGGIWLGECTECATTACPAIGACCLPSCACVDLTAADCLAADGDFKGVGVCCENLVEECPCVPRGDCDKGSLLIFSKVEIRWDTTGNLIQDTFINLTNDYPEDLRVLMYFVNGDPPLDADTTAQPPERAHPGWNWLDNEITLTANEPTSWSAHSGQPKGVSPWEALDPGFPPGRPDPFVPGERMLRGYIVAIAVNPAGEQIRWNHLAGGGTLLHYGQSSAWQYCAWAFQARGNPLVDQGDPIGTAGLLLLDGIDYSVPYSHVLMHFHAVGSTRLSGGARQVIADTDVTLFPVPADFRQETLGPLTTKAHFDVWNENEVKFSGAHRCITCWDQMLLSGYDSPNHFLQFNLQTAVGKARIDGLASQECDVDIDPTDGPLGTHPDDVISLNSAILGLEAKHLAFDGGVAHARAGSNMIGMGEEPAAILFDVTSPPPETPEQWIEMFIDHADHAIRRNFNLRLSR